MDPKRRKTQDSAENVDSSAADTGNSGVAESKATDSKAKPVELNAEAEKSNFVFRKWRSSPTYPKAMEKGKSTLKSFHKQQLEQRRGSRPVQIIYLHPLHKEVEELNRKKDIVCLILSSPPMNSMNKERHEKWVRGVLRMNHKVREWKTFSSKKNKVLDSHRSEIDALLDHTFDDIEAYVPPLIIKKMCKKTWPVTQPDQKARNLAVNFATRQILDEIENPEVLRIRISGRNGIRVTSAVKDLPQIQQRFNIVIQVDASLYPNIRGIEENIATQLGFSLNIQMLNKFLKTTSFLIFLDDIYESIDLYKVGSEWWNSKNIQKIVCRTRSQTVCRRMAVDREIRLDDHLLSWELFCRNVGNIVHSSGFQHRATDVVQKCSGHLLAVVLMARALNMVFNVSTWEHASYLLSLPHRSQMEDRVLYNALAFIMGQCSGSAHECVKYCAFYMEREGANKLDLIQEWIRHELISTFDEGQKMVRGLVSAFLLESSQNGYSVRM
ncbi:probable disease resistance protein At4g27220 [Vitis vinifera]|nr:probable disease resistance protein At4g27220 [Vitis vinifera]|eukprot:XP_002267753.2 PREDICTED: probable disease resistance protein At4g27220 [Vitis vinifera]